jgi:hypothetical protein
MDRSPRSRISNQCSRSPAARGRAHDYGERFATSQMSHRAGSSEVLPLGIWNRSIACFGLIARGV